MEMMMNKNKLELYSYYKESQNEWIGKIPQHWNLKPIRAIFQERREKNMGPKTDFILSVTRYRGVIPYDEKGAIGNNKSEDIERYKVVYPKDLVINKMNVVIGSLGLSKYHGALSQVYIILSPKSDEFDINFFSYVFSNPSFYKSLIKYCSGIMALRESLNLLEFKKLPLPIPPIEEQSRIVNFLDAKCAKINQVIQQKEKLIELLKERKQIIIQNGVTRGLNPDVKMKDSGVDLIGDIPEHWEVVQIRRLLYGIEQGSSPSIINSTDLEWAVLKLSAIKQGNFYATENKLIPKSLYESKYQVKQGDFLLTRGNTPELVADVCLVLKSPQTSMMISDLIYRLSIDESKADKEYLLYFMLSKIARIQIKMSARGSSSSMSKVSQSHIKSWLITLPPLKEQKIISRRIQEINHKIKKSINLQTQQIKKLKEYKQVLINEVVTGKVKV